MDKKKKKQKEKKDDVRLVEPSLPSPGRLNCEAAYGNANILQAICQQWELEAAAVAAEH
jgi:hypothetical protein